MATSFRGWGTSWANSWGPIAVDPNAMIGAAGFTLTAIATLTSGVAPSDISGSASLTFSAIGVLTDPNATANQGWDTSQGVARKNKPTERNHYVDFLNRQFERKSRLQKEDQLACEFIMALVQTELLDG